MTQPSLHKHAYPVFLKPRLAAGRHDLLCGTFEHRVDGMPHAVHVCELLKTFRPSQANVRSTRTTIPEASSRHFAVLRRTKHLRPVLGTP